MKIKISLIGDEEIILPKNFNHIFQATVYSLLDKAFATWLHEEGYQYKKRFFKHFSFSDILTRGRFDKRRDLFVFPNRINFVISSPLDKILEQIAKNTVLKEKIRLGNNLLFVESVEIVHQTVNSSNKIRINTLSPVEVHSTFEKKDGTKKTYYYDCYEKEFSELVNNNLKEKWETIFGEKCPYNLNIEPVRKEYIKKRVVNFKGTWIKGLRGHFWLEGDPELLQFALDASLGSSNPRGFGCIEMVEEGK